MLLRIPARGQYALQALVDIVLAGRDRHVNSVQIAKRQGIPARFLELILKSLCLAGYLDSRRGSAGGYRLLVAPERLSVAQVMRAVDGALSPFDARQPGPALLGSPEPADGLLLTPPLAVWQRAHEAIEAVLEQTTLAALVDEYRAAQSRQSPDWVI